MPADGTLAALTPAEISAPSRVQRQLTKDCTPPQQKQLSFPRAALGPDRKKLAAYSALGGKFLRFPIMPADGTLAALTPAEISAPSRVQRQLTKDCTPPQQKQLSFPRAALALDRKKLAAFSALGGGLRLPAWPRLGHNFANDL